MTWRSAVAAALAACVVGLANCPAAEKKDDKSAVTSPHPSALPKGEGTSSKIQYLPLDAPAGMSQAVIVQGLPLVHTRQLLPVDRAGKLVGADSVDQQIEQVLTNLESVLNSSGSGLDKLVRVNVYALTPQTVDRVRELLNKRLHPPVRPTITAVLTPLTHRKALVAVDAVAVGADKGSTVASLQCPAVAGSKDCADAAVMPRGGVAYLSGVPEEGSLSATPVARSMATLMRTLGRLKLTPANVVQLRVFVKPATAADEVIGELKKVFPGQLVPPVVFVEWIAPIPIEIEMIASLSAAGKPAQSVEYYTPPDVRPAHTFSRVALVGTERQIYISGLFAHMPGKGEAQATDVFDQLKVILDKTGSDMQHLVKASYYVVDDDAGRGFDRVRPRYFNPTRPPAASKVTVHGVGQAQRTLTMDIIAVGPRP